MRWSGSSISKSPRDEPQAALEDISHLPGRAAPYLVIVLAVPSDRERERLRADSRLKSELRRLLHTVQWPEPARQHVVFDIESQETVARDNNGNWWQHYK